MTATSRGLAIASVACLLLFPALSHAQNVYELSWNRVAAGGISATGGLYKLGGTAGQPDAGVRSGGVYTLSAGFWPGATPAFPVSVDPEADLDLLPPGLAARCYPNPSTERVTISFGLHQPEHVRLYLFDVSGRVLRVLTDGVLARGAHNAAWDGMLDGRRAQPGVYFYKLDAGRESANGKFVIVR